MTSYYLNDIGLVCPLGSGLSEIKQGLFNGSREGMVERADLLPDRSCIVGEVDTELPAIPTELSHYHCRNNQLALAALLQIEKTIEQTKNHYGSDRVGVVMASSTSGVAATEQALKHFSKHQCYPPGYHFNQQQLGGLAEFVAAYCRINGPAFTISTACSSGANAVASARRLLNLGVCDAIIVGGADSLCQLTVQGFAALESISSGYCSPFSAQRDGINVGEAAAVFVLSREKQGVELLGVGCSCDAYHISGPAPDGSGAATAMQTALEQADLQPEDIDYLNLHGTATPQNDAMESKAVSKVFPTGVPCSSTKALTGHTLGTAAVLELGFCWLLIQHNPEHQLPRQYGAGKPDQTLPAIGLIDEDFQATTPIRYCMSNAFAFGGNNTSIIVGGISQ